MVEFLCWQLRNLLALRGLELVCFLALVASGVGLYYSLKFVFRFWPNGQRCRPVQSKGRVERVPHIPAAFARIQHATVWNSGLIRSKRLIVVSRGNS